MTFEEDLVRNCISPEEYSRYQQLLFLASLTDNPNIRYCSQPDCEGLISISPHFIINVDYYYYIIIIDHGDDDNGDDDVVDELDL
jgi:hypothetical protein